MLGYHCHGFLPYVITCKLQVYLVRGNHEFRDMSENMGELGFLCLRLEWRYLAIPVIDVAVSLCA